MTQISQRAEQTQGTDVTAERRANPSTGRPADRNAFAGAPQAEAKPIPGTDSGAVSELLLTPRVLDARGYDELARQLSGLIEEAKSQTKHLQGLVDSIGSAGATLRQIETQAHGKIALGRRVSRELDDHLVQGERIARGLTAAVEGADRVGRMVEGLQENFDLVEQQFEERLAAQRERYERAVQTLRRSHIAQMRALRAEMVEETQQTASEVQRLQEEMAATLRQVRTDFEHEAQALRRAQGGLLAELEEQVEGVRVETAESLSRAEQHVLRITAEAVDGAEDAVRGMEERIAAVKLASEAARRSVAALRRVAGEPSSPGKAANSPRADGSSDP